MITRRSSAFTPAAWLAAHGVTAVRLHGAPSPSDPPSRSTIAPPGGGGRAEFPAQPSELVREAVVEYLTALGDADPPPPRAPLSAEQMTLLAGAYAIDGGGSEPVVIAPSNGQLSFGLAGRSRGLRHEGSLEFSPAGADTVRVVFEVGAGAVVLTVHDPGEVLRARKAVKQ